MAIDHAVERPLFEQAMYARYTYSCMRASAVGATGIAVGLPADTMDRAAFCKLNADGIYELQGLQGMWFAWQDRAELDASGDLFAMIEDVQQALEAHLDEQREQAERVPKTVADLVKTLGAFVLSTHARAGQ